MGREKTLPEYILRREQTVQQALGMCFWNTFWSSLWLGQLIGNFASTKQSTNWEDMFENFRMNSNLDDGVNEIRAFMELSTERKVISK